MGLRRLVSLVMGLPPNSALHRSVDPNGAAWGNTEELLASLIEVTDYGNRLFFSANTKKGTRLPKPIQIVRPGEQVPESKPEQPRGRKQSSPDDIRRFAGAHLKVVPKES